MSEFSPEEIQNAADEVRRGGFGDFMFRDPGQNRGTSRRRTTRRQITSRRRTTSRDTSRNRNTTRRNTSRRRTSRKTTRRCCSGWRNTSRGNEQTRSCWRDGNMWEYCVRNRK
ncbi:hypothetical protein J1P26_21295 [Neobacillus sp. MM2021_6]|uniref:CotG/ExsB N-terminal domain-containing protein n=1 Tax=Bacillaceae TaxID=186817 RepID=UPI0014091DB1|nr:MULTISPECIES: hypothetical protein [Bacillaceae]MBO0962241.1 hypothetical protein [Neobacillus sp. MM2021_6]NHC18254.1 hypothetical protein [Bacillus sp. MM2020_4]